MILHHDPQDDLWIHGQMDSPMDTVVLSSSNLIQKGFEVICHLTQIRNGETPPHLHISDSARCIAPWVIQSLYRLEVPIGYVKEVRVSHSCMGGGQIEA